MRTLTETAYIKISTKNEIRNHEQFGMQKMFDNLYQQSKNQTLPKNLYKIVTMTNNIALATTILKSKDYNSNIINDVRKSFNNYQPNLVKSHSQIVNLLVQQSIKQVLEPICEARFHSHNYGNRAHRTASHAIARVVSLTNVNKLHYSTSIDIQNLYDNVNHGKLLKQLWTLGVRDKKLLAIISKMLKVNGTKGLPHNNILTPLLANVYLNELDWWISDQWETYQTHHNYDLHRTKNGKRYVDKSGKYRALRTSSNLKEIYVVRHGNQIRLFCRNHNDSIRIRIAMEKWLYERLQIPQTEIYMKSINLRKHSMSFLGFRIKVVKNKDKYTARTHVSESSKQNAINHLKQLVKNIQKHKHPHEVFRINAKILKLQNYYKTATMVSKDFADIAYSVERTLYNRLKKDIKRDGPTTDYYKNQYKHWKSYKPIFLYNVRLYLISDIKMDVPMKLNQQKTSFTEQGRSMMANSDISKQIIDYLTNTPIHNASVEYNNNRLVTYTKQKGLCYVTGLPLEINNMNLHHKIPKWLGGTDDINNLVYIIQDVHKLLHAKKAETINQYLEKLRLDKKAISKLNMLRKLAANDLIV